MNRAERPKNLRMFSLNLTTNSDAASGENLDPVCQDVLRVIESVISFAYSSASTVSLSGVAYYLCL